MSLSQSKFLSLALLAASASAQNFATYQTNNHQIAVSIPSSTASGSSQSIFFQILAPSGTTWSSFGQGSGMSGANMFVLYSSGDGNVTVSPRLGAGHVMPQFNSDAQISVLEGTGVQPDGSLLANIRCDTCLSWGSGESMTATDSSSNWVYAYKSGSSLDSTDTSANIQQHGDQATFTLDLTKGVGGTSSNPFISSAAAGTGAAPSATSGVAGPVATSDSGSSSAGTTVTSGSNTDMIRRSHAIIMSLIFLILFPLAALTLYLPYTNKVRYVHAPLQAIGLILLIVGLALGVVLGKTTELDAYHQVVGYIVVGLLILFQPALGIYQHLHYRKTGGKSPMGIIHRWLGRCVIILGVINGGLGFKIAGRFGSDDSPNWAIVTYSIIAGVIFLVYISVILAVSWRSKYGSSTKSRGEKGWGLNSSQGSSPQTNSPPRFGNNNGISNPRGNPSLGQGARQQYR